LDADYLPADLRDTVAAEFTAATTMAGATIELGADVAERFRAAFTERLAQVGFDAGYELTDEGASLEELIDAFFGGTGRCR
jgi:hypothetical protein